MTKVKIKRLKNKLQVTNSKNETYIVTEDELAAFIDTLVRHFNLMVNAFNTFASVMNRIQADELTKIINSFEKAK